MDRSELGARHLRGEQVSSETAWSGPPPPPLLTCKLLQGRDACCHPKGHEARCPWGPGDKDQKGLSARSPKTLGGLEKMRVRGESKEAGQEAQERAVGWRHGWMDRRGEEGKGWIDRWMDRRTNAEGAGVQ